MKYIDPIKSTILEAISNPKAGVSLHDWKGFLTPHRAILDPWKFAGSFESDDKALAWQEALTTAVNSSAQLRGLYCQYLLNEANDPSDEAYDLSDFPPRVSSPNDVHNDVERLKAELAECQAKREQLKRDRDALRVAIDVHLGATSCSATKSNTLRIAIQRLCKAHLLSQGGEFEEVTKGQIYKAEILRLKRIVGAFMS